MSGVMVLNEYFTKAEFPIWCAITCVVLLFLCVLFVITGVEADNGYVFFIGLFSGIALMAVFVYGIYLSEQQSTTKEYQVTISDNVSMTEFMEKYEIINVDGKIYTIRDK